MIFMESLMYPLATEKALNMVDRDNVISYVVDKRTNKEAIKKEFEKAFNVKVERVSTAIGIRGYKKAFIKLKKDYRASDIARRLKLV